MVVPKREGVIVAVGEDDGISLLRQALEVVLSEVTAAVASAAVVVVPGLRHHLQGHEQTDQREECHGQCLAGLLSEPVGNSRSTQSNPDGEGVERTCVGIISFARLAGRLVQVDDDRDAGHEEEEEDHPELLDAGVCGGAVSGVLACLPEESEQTQQQWQAEEDVASLVLAQFAGHAALVAEAKVVEEGDAREPVAVLQFSIALNVVLPAGKVPHKVAPVHEVDLIGEEEADVFQLGGHFHHDGLATAVEGNLSADDASQPRLVGLLVFWTVAVHTRKEHVLSVDIFDIVALDLVAVGLIGTGLFFALVDGSALLGDRYAVAAFSLQGYL